MEYKSVSNTGQIFVTVYPVFNAVWKPISLQNATSYWLKSGSEVITLFFMLSSAEHEILNAHKYKNIKKLSIFQAQISLVCYFSCS